MPSTTFELLEQLETTQGTNAKRALLAANKNNFVLQQVMQVTLDPYLNYGVVKIKKPKPVARKTTNEGVMIAFTSLLLGELADRSLSGNAAKAAVEKIFAQANALEQKWLDRVLKRNLRCGASTSIVNDTWPGTVRGFETSLCDTLKVNAKELKPAEIAAIKPPLANGEIRGSGRTYLACFGGSVYQFDFKGDLPKGARVNPKLDGLRCVALKVNGKVTLFTRNGNEIDTLPEIVAALEAAPYDDRMLDGEAMADGDEAWNDSMSVIGSTKNTKDTSGMRYNVFDAMPIDEWNKQRSTEKYSVRDANAGKVVAGAGDPIITHVDTKVCNSFRELLEYYIECLDNGFEGVVIKDPNATYQFERSSAMLKFKPEATYEGAVIGWFKGSRGSKRADKFAGFWVLLPNGVATRCGTGFKDNDKAAFHAEIQANGMQKFLGNIMEVKGQPPLTKEGKIRFPRFKRWRSPKDVDPSVMKAYNAWLKSGGSLPGNAPPIER